jgi:hypothetical protein
MVLKHEVLFRPCTPLPALQDPNAPRTRGTLADVKSVHSSSKPLSPRPPLSFSGTQGALMMGDTGSPGSGSPPRNAGTSPPR